jgi:hypothetical protein
MYSPTTAGGTSQGQNRFIGDTQQTGAANPYGGGSGASPYAASPALGIGSGPNATPGPNMYASALQQQFAPYFQQSYQDLGAQEAGMGILNSGAANKDFQDLTARNNSTYASALTPLIQQGFGEQFQAQQSNQQAYDQFQLAQMGITNNDYLAQMGQLGGLYSQGLGASGSIYGQGMNDEVQGYQLPQTQNNGAGGAMGGQIGSFLSTAPWDTSW